MESEIIDFNKLQIDKAKIAQKLSLNESDFETNMFLNTLFDSVYDEISKICKPSFCYKKYSIGYPTDSDIVIGGVSFSTGKIISKLARGGDWAYVFIATSSSEFENYLRSLKGDSVKEFFADAIGSEIPEAVISFLKNTIKESFPEIEFDISLSFSPGYCGWNINEQSKLFSLMPANPCRVVLNESSLMTPIKSVSGFMAAGNFDFPQEYLCKKCKNRECIYK